MLYGWQQLTPVQEDMIRRGVIDGKVYGGPFHLNLFPTDRCNLDCFFCYTEELRDIAAELDWEVLHRTLRDGVEMGVTGVSFGGGGEPMIYRPIGKLMDFLEEHDLQVDSVKSNGTAVTPRIASSLVRLNMKRVTVSLNETTPDAYGEMNQCSPRLYERAIAGIENLVAARRERSAGTEISIQIFVWKGNYRRLVEMVEGLQPLGADLVYINTIDQQPPEKQMSPEEKEEFKDIVREVLRRWPRQVQLNLWAEGLGQFGAEEHHKVWKESVELPEMVKTDYRIEYCYIGWHSPTVAANGHVFPCCHFATDQSRTLGSLHEQSLREIWYGERAGRYRDEMRHLMLTEVDDKLAKRHTCFVHELCKHRTACAFNYYLASPEFYHSIHDWAESGPRQLYKAQRHVEVGVRDTLRLGRQAVQAALGKKS